jgi:Ricin-type beta-trefoil lectin domain
MGILLAATIALTAQPASAYPPDYRMLANHQTGECLDVTGAAMQHAADVAIWTCVGADNQGWRAVSVDGGYFQIQVLHSGMCLDVGWASTAPGANVLQATCTPGQENQHWRFAPLGGPWFQLVARHSNQCLDKAGGDVVQFPCDPGKWWQQWIWI